jgi:hypothetical protein
MLSVLLRFTVSDYLFGIFKLFSFYMNVRLPNNSVQRIMFKMDALPVAKNIK